MITKVIKNLLVEKLTMMYLQNLLLLFNFAGYFGPNIRFVCREKQRETPGS